MLALFLLCGCAVRHPVRAFHTVHRKWVNSELAYDRWWERNIMPICLKQGHTREECDPNWKPCPNGSTQASCQ